MSEFRKLILPQEEALVRAKLEGIIEHSFAVVDPGRLTRSAVRERFDILVDGFVTMRGQLKWSQQRTFDTLPTYLHCKLNRIPWEPSKRRSWGAPDRGELGSPVE